MSLKFDTSQWTPTSRNILGYSRGV